MTKVIRLLFAVVGVLVLLLVAAIVIIPLVVDPNDYKEEISSLVKTHTGRDLEIPGEIGLSVFPWLALELGEVSLSNAPDFGDQPFARVQSAAVRVKLMPLLDKRVEMDTVSLQGLILHLSKAQDGRTNWDDLAGPAKEETEPKASEPPSEGSVPLAALAIGGVKISESRVVWDDRSTGQHVELDGLRLETGAIEPGKPVDLELEFDLKNQEPALATHTKLTGRLELDESFSTASIDGLRLVLDLQEAPGNVRGTVELSADASADLAAQRYQIQGLELTVDAQGETLPGGAAKATFTGAVAADLAIQTLQLSELRLTTYGLELTGALEGQKIVDDPKFQGKFVVPGFSPRDLLQALEQEIPTTADPEALSQAEMSFSLSATADSANIEDLALRLDESRVEGKVAVSEFQKPAIRFGLKLDEIDVDRYLPPKSEEESEPAPTPAEATTAAVAELPTETLRALNLDGSFDIGRMKVSGLKAEDIKLTIKARDGKLSTQQTIGRFYEGGYTSAAELDVRGEKATWSLSEQLTGVAAGPMLADLLGKEQLTGKAEISADIRGTGTDPDVAKKSAQGTASFSFTNGAVKGINVARLIREAQARIKGEPLPPSDEADQTEFSELKGTLDIADGVVRNRDLLAKSPLLRLTGEGEANLVEETVDYLVKPVIVGTLEGQGGKELEELKGIPIPIRVIGSLFEPSFKLDTKALLDAKAKAKIEEEKAKAKVKIEEKVQEELQDKLPEDTVDKAKELLNGLFR